MDWIDEFKARFENREEISNLKRDKFHGSVAINFSDGVPINCNMKLNIIPTQKKGG